MQGFFSIMESVEIIRDVALAAKEKCRELGLNTAQAALLLSVSGSTWRRWISSEQAHCLLQAWRRLVLFIEGSLDGLARQIVFMYGHEASWEEAARPLVRAWHAAMSSENADERLPFIYKESLMRYLREAQCR